MQAGDFNKIDGSNQVYIVLTIIYVTQDQTFEYDANVKNSKGKQNIWKYLDEFWKYILCRLY